MSVEGADKVIRSLNKLPRQLQQRIQDSLNVSAAEMMNAAIIKIQKNSGTGRVYRRGKRVHIASSPGEYPNSDSGELVNSMFWKADGALEAIWGASAKHARPLENGTSRMAARPFMRPTFNALKARASSRVMSAVQSAMAEAARG